jgi:hypothetical protein
MPELVTQTLHQEAVSHARLAGRSASLAWAHLAAEYTQDIDQVLATLDETGPLTWTLPQMVGDDGGVTYLAGVNMEEIRGQYENLRELVQIHGWDALAEIRQGWYMLTHGVTTLKVVATGETSRGETVTMFPAWNGGILGEVQIGEVGTRRESRWPEVPKVPGDIPLPGKRLEALACHNSYLDALRAEDVGALVAAHRVNGAATIRNYLTSQSTLLNTTGVSQLANYFSALFERFRVMDIQLVNRLVESWYVFAELHWVVEERAGERRILEFCTAETSPLDPDGKYWVRTGAGTDPIEA